MENNNKIVEFWHYCNRCKYADLPESKDPCNECLEVSVREGTVEPEKFELFEQKWQLLRKEKL